jgi:ribosomal protein S6--L-glutamate ligase
VTRVAFLLGQPPGEGSVLPEVLAHLRSEGVDVRVFTWRPDMPLEALADNDLVVLRGLSAAALDQVAALEATGIKCCNKVAATRLARDKAATMQHLERARLPVPDTILLEDWTAVRRRAAGRPVAVKSAFGSRGAGVLLADADTLPEQAPFAGSYLLQERVASQGPDRKLYVVGANVWGLCRTWPASTLEDKLGTPFEPAPDERSTALRAGEALGLEVFGVDLLSTPRGHVVVDVNAFPGFKGVAGAATAIARYLLDRARTPGERCGS